MGKLEKIKEALDDRRLDKVSEASGVSYNTVRAIRRGGDINPTQRTLDRLADYLGVEE